MNCLTRLPSTLPRTCLSTLAAMALAQAAPVTTVPYLKVDQFGYLPGMRKVAVVVDPQTGFNAAEGFNPGTGANQYQVLRWSDDAVVFTGTLQAWRSGAVHTSPAIVDGISISQPSPPRVPITSTTPSTGWAPPASRSGPPSRHRAEAGGPDVLYQRVNFAKNTPFAGAKWTDGRRLRRPQPGSVATSRFNKGNATTARDLSGGWMDAGDSNKYTTFAQGAVLQLLEAYRMNPLVFADDFGIPESGNGVVRPA